MASVYLGGWVVGMDGGLGEVSSNFSSNILATTLSPEWLSGSWLFGRKIAQVHRMAYWV